MPLSAWRKWWRRSTPRSKKPNPNKKHKFRKCFLEILEDRTLLSANLYTVNITSDNVINTGQQTSQFSGDLRWCIEQANLNPGSTIQFDNSVFPLSTSTTIKLSQGELQVAASMTIQGEGSNVITVSGNDGKGGKSRVFDITSSNAVVTISGLTIADGNAAPNYTPVSGNQGGDIFNGGTLTLQNDIVTNGFSIGSVGGPIGKGGAIFNAEGQGITKLTLDNTVVENSTARGPNGGNGGNGRPVAQPGGAGGQGEGGGIYNDVTAQLILQNNSRIINNTALGGDGGNGGNGTADGTGSTGGTGGAGGLGGFAKGGAIYNAGIVQLNGTNTISIILAGNTAQGGKGGLGGTGANGQDGALGGNGGGSGNGGGGGLAEGGGIYNTGSGTFPSSISLQFVNFLGDQAIGGAGNNSNIAGNAGNGTKGAGGVGGNGGRGGGGGNAQGGAIYTAWGALTVPNSLFGSDVSGPSDQALGGAAGNGGTAGNGGNSSGGVAFGRGTQGGASGTGGIGGNGGFAKGGAVANVTPNGGNVAFTTTIFDSTVARAGNGGNGGASGKGGQGAQANEGSTKTPYSAGLGGVGEPGGNAGFGGAAVGGGIFNAIGSLSITSASFFLSDQAIAGSGGTGGTGGTGGNGGNKTSKSLHFLTFQNGGIGGQGGTGGVGGNAQGGGFYNLLGAVTVLNSTFKAKSAGGIGNEVIGGSGGGGGAGGTGGQGGDNGAGMGNITGGAGGPAGAGGLASNGGFAEGGAAGNEGGDTHLTGDIFTSNLVQLGTGGTGGSGGRGGDGGNSSNNGNADGVGANGGNAADGAGFNVYSAGFLGSGFGGAFANTAGNLTVSNSTFGGGDSSLGNQVVGGAGGAGGVGGGWGHWGHTGGSRYTWSTGSFPFAGNGGHGGLGAYVYGGSLSVGANAQTVQITNTTFTNSAISSGAGGNGGQAGLFSFEGSNGGINGIGGDGGLAQGGAVSISATAAQSATLNIVTIASSSATAGPGGSGAVNFLGSVNHPLFGRSNGDGSKGGNGGSVQGVGLADVNYNLAVTGVSSFTGGTGKAGMGGTGGTESVPEPFTFKGGKGGDGGKVLGGGIFFSNSTSGTLNFNFTTGSASNNRLNGGAGGNGGNAGGSGSRNIAGGAGGDGGSAQGGGIYILAGSNAVNSTALSSLLLDTNNLTGGTGGVGGAGFKANGGNGGDADGGGLFNSSSDSTSSSTLSVTGTTLAANQLTSGIGGDAGSGTTPNGGAGGTGGNAGDAEGGGLFDGTNTSLTVVNTTFGGGSTNPTTPLVNANILIGSRGGRGGDAGTPTGVIKNDGGPGGNGGNVEGGNVFVSGGTSIFINDTLVFGQAKNVGLPGAGGSGAGQGGANGAAGANGVGLAGGFFAGAGSTDKIGNTIIDLNDANVVPTVSPDVSGSFTSLGNNILGRAATTNGFTGSGDQINVSAAALNIGPLLSNGGPNLTDALLNNGTTSAAIDKGGNTLVTNAGNPWFNLFGANPTDQRGTGFPRINNTTVDIGAFEFDPPVISNLNPPSQPEQGLPFVLTITGTGFATGATVTWAYEGDAYVGPSSTVLNPSSVSLTQIQVTVPTELLPDEGTVDVTVSVPDGSGVAGETLTSNSAPFTITDSGSLTLSNPGPQNANEGDLVNLDPITSTDPGTNFAAINLPPGLSIGLTTGVISGTIDRRGAGTYNVTIQGVDPDTNTVEGTAQFTWTVNDTTPPDLTAPPTQNNNEGDVLSAANNNTVTVAAVDADPGTFTDVFNGKHTLPTGLTIDANGVISGTIGLRAAGNYTVTITASDDGNTSNVSFQWIVADTTPPVVTAPSNQTSNEGQTIAPLKVQAVDADSFNITGLPGGLTYNSTTGVISGTINLYADGIYTVTITATDNGFQSTPVSFTWTVNDTTPPSFTNPGTQNNNEGDSVTLNTNPVDADAASIKATGLPTGLTIDSTTGIISGVIDPRAAGSYTVTISATDGSLKGSTTFSWIVADTTPPVVTNPGNQTNDEGQTIPTLNIQAQDADSFNITGLPGGLTYNTKTGAISGTIGAYAAGTYTVTIVATDNPNIQSTPVSFTWTVNDTTPPALTNPGNQSTNEGVTISPLTIQATDAESFTITGLPTGLTFDATLGVISGTVDSRGAGIYTVKVIAFDGALSSSTQFTWTINDTTPPVINNPGTRNSNEGDTVSLQIGSIDADPGTFMATGLPTGLNIDGNGLISGTIDPRAEGTYTVTVSANDGVNNPGSATFTWIVADTTPPSITAPADQSSNEGDIVSLPIQAVDADSFSATGLPKGLSIDPTTGLISGTIDLQAADNSPYTVTIFASDNGNTSSVTFKWTVADTTPPSFTNPGDQISSEGQAIVLATNPVGADPGTIKATGLPPGLSINSTTGVISGTIDPRGAGAYAVTVSGSDNGNSSSFSLVWRVNDTTPPVLGSPGTQNTNNGAFVAVAVPSIDADAGTFTASGLPAGLSINANTGVISGTVFAQAGTYNVTVSASDGGQATSVSFAWVVNQLPISVNITNIHNSYAGPFQIETVTAQVTDPSGITINSGTVTFHVNGETFSAPVKNGFATVTFVTPMVSLDFTILMNDFFSHSLDATFSDPSGLFGTAGASVSEPAMLLDFVLFLQASQLGSLASQLAQLQQNQ
jgi:hypothetical protein